MQTIAEREAAEKAEAAAEEQQKARLVERQQETRQLLVHVIAADEAAARAAAAPVALKDYGEIDTDDEAEPDAIDRWQRREAARIRYVCTLRVVCLLASLVDHNLHIGYRVFS